MLRLKHKDQGPSGPKQWNIPLYAAGNLWLYHYMGPTLMVEALKIKGSYWDLPEKRGVQGSFRIAGVRV